MAVQQIDTLLERDQALAAIDELIDASGSGYGSILAIEGAAGLGKTALVALARDRAVKSGFKVASARGGELERDFPFGIVRQLLEPAVARATVPERRRLFEGAAQLAAPLVGAWQPLARGSAPARGFGQPAGAAMHGLYWLLVNFLHRGPLLLCVDDAHWGDAASLRWLHYLARRLEGLGVAVIVATRPGEPGVDSRVLEAIAAEPLTSVIRLEPLSTEGSGVFVRRALGIASDNEFCAACHAASGGNPFLLEELLGALAREGVTPTAEFVGRVRELVPESVTRSVRLRLARLSAAAGALARAAAVLGSSVSLHDAAGLADLDHREAAGAAAALADLAILRPGTPLEFVHPLIRGAVYDALPATERGVWHARAARQLASAGARSEHVAAQLLRSVPAGDSWAVAQLRAAAADAMTRADPRAAIEFLRRALVEAASADERGAISLELLRAGFVGGDVSWLDEHSIAEIAGDPALLEASAEYLGTVLWVTGRAEEGLAVLERALSAATSVGDLQLALRVEVRRIMFAQLLPHDALCRLEPYGARLDPDSTEGRLLEASLAWYGSVSGRPATETLKRCRRAFGGGHLVTALQDDPLLLAGYVLPMLCTDELEFCNRVIEQILREGRARGSAPAVAAGSYLSAYLAYLRGELVHAEGHIRVASGMVTEDRFMATLPLLTALLVDTLTDRGELYAAADELATAGFADGIPDLWWFGPLLWSRGHLRIAQGKARAGIEDLLEFGRRCDRDGIVATVTRPWASYAAPLLAQQGDRHAARRLAERELGEARAWGTARSIGQAQRGLGLVTGGAEGIRLLREAVRTLESSPARLEQARALIDLGAGLRRTNQRAAAREPLRRGLDLAHRCGARGLTARAVQELRATGAKPRKLVLAGVDALTASERRIAEMATAGLTNREIAQALFVTIKTVETHMAHVFQKLDVNSRKELGPVLRRAITRTS